MSDSLRSPILVSNASPDRPPADPSAEASASLDPFSPPGVVWQAVNPKLMTVRLLTLAFFGGPLMIAGIVLCIIFPTWWLIGVTVVVTTFLTWQALLTRRRVRAMAYSIRDRDFFQRSGLMFRRLSVVPYVRIQYVDVNVGPLMRAFGLASLSVNTASPTVSATLVGVSPEEAARIRDILTDRKNLVGEEPTSATPAADRPDSPPVPTSTQPSPIGDARSVS